MGSYEKKEKLNEFFVSCFYSILNAEERALESLSNGKLSLKEIHVIEAVYKAKAAGNNNFSTIAKLLNITPGTLTASFTKLEEKGYLVRVQHTSNKRVYYIEPTPLAEMINEKHTVFHERMIDDIVHVLPDIKIDELIDTLGVLTRYFNRIKSDFTRPATAENAQ